MAFIAFRGMRPFHQLIFTGFIVLICFLSFTLLSLAVAIPLFGFDSLINIPGINDIGNPESIRILKYFQVVQSVGLFIIPPVIAGWFFSEKLSEYLFLNRSITSSSIVLAILITILALPFINYTGELNSRMQLPQWLSGVESWMKNAEENAALLTDAFLEVKTLGGLLFNLFMIAFLPAIGEELLFRGVIQRIFTNWTKSHNYGIWISAILFSALHMQFYGFIPRMILGVLFGYLLVWSGSVWLPILAHFINNAFAVIMIHLINNNILNPEIEDIGATPESHYFALFSLVVAGSLMLMIKNLNRDKIIDIPSN